MRQILREKAKQSGYYDPETRKFNPTEENIQIQIDYEYKAEFVPIEVLDEAKKEFPLDLTIWLPWAETWLKSLPKNTNSNPFSTDHALMIKWFVKWFGGLLCEAV